MKNKKQPILPPSSSSNLHNSQDKGYNRESAKLALEKYLLESVKEFFDQTTNSCKSKNDERSKVNQSQESGLSNMQCLETKSRVLITTISNYQKLSATQKTAYIKIVNST